MNEDILNSHWDIGKGVDIKSLDKVETAVLFVLYRAEEAFDVQELTSNQIFHLLNDKLRYKASMQAINNAIRRSKKKISSVKRDRTTYHKIMSSGMEEIREVLQEPERKEVLDLIIPSEIMENEKGYIKNVVRQVNGCYQDEYYDACFVMIRRLVETLIVELYEELGCEQEITNSDGDYLYLEGLIDAALQKREIKLSKTSKRDLKKLKKFGDVAAHNRKLNLKRSDIDKYSDSVRIIVEELVNNRK